MFTVTVLIHSFNMSNTTYIPIIVSDSSKLLLAAIYMHAVVWNSAIVIP